MFANIVNGINDALYSYVLIIVLVLGGVTGFRKDDIGLTYETDYWN